MPEFAEIGGKTYRINADYRDILDIITRLNNQEESEQTRLYVALALFYEDFTDMPRKDYQEAANWMMRFISCGEEETDAHPRPKLLDWEQDRNMIVADINKVAGCEVRALPFCHWWTFIAWFNAIGKGQLSTVVSIRDKLRRGKKLEKWEQEFYRDHKTQVTLKQRYTAEELAERERLKKLLGE
ncbi:Gp15 family bacteriophage protein [Anaeromassilibacillus sp. An250]|uniref:Gp15 family bacteriophage protein n=1 Tax=Anaeromassilibacillus sp. An250 TaxID=1965604 RepID=UPI00155F2A4D|nr:Gp15 family bacteriophage protein [Anaeromassilibacillus sp. An250]